MKRKSINKKSLMGFSSLNNALDMPKLCPFCKKEMLYFESDFYFGFINLPNNTVCMLHHMAILDVNFYFLHTN